MRAPLMTTVRRFFLRLLSFFRADAAEAELSREIRSHLQLLEDQFVAQGLPKDEARLAARRAFGGVEQVKEHQRDARGFRWLDNSRIDVKLGARMLTKYPGLSIIGGLGLAVGVGIGAAFFALIYSQLYATLPVEHGERIVALENWDVEINNEMQQAMHDLHVWRRELEDGRGDRRVPHHRAQLDHPRRIRRAGPGRAGHGPSASTSPAWRPRSDARLSKPMKTSTLRRSW